MSAETAYDVVVNDEEQYSIWPAGRELPEGWRTVGVSGRKDECLAHIREVWTDITPLSVRRRLAAPGSGTERGTQAR
jgi:MbtH protein